MQFSLRALLAAIAIVGIGAALWGAEPSWRLGAIEAFLLAWVPGSTAALSVHSIGRTKTFWIGVTSACIFPPITLIIIGSMPYDYPILMSGPDTPRVLGLLEDYLRTLSLNFRTALISWAFSPVVGLLCVFTHWLFIRSDEPRG